MPQSADSPWRYRYSLARSLANSASSGAGTAVRQRPKVIAPNTAIAVIGAKFGGCGRRRVRAAARMNRVSARFLTVANSLELAVVRLFGPERKPQIVALPHDVHVPVPRR